MHMSQRLRSGLILLFSTLGQSGCAERPPAINPVAAATERPAPPIMPIDFRILDFDLSPGRSCDNGWIDGSYCVATAPKSWTVEESMTLRSWMSQLPTKFLARIRLNGFTTFYRYGHGFLKLPSGSYERAEPLAWVWGVDKSINFSDFVFFPGMPPDPISAYDFGQKTFVHELAHAYDSGAIGAEFLELLGWQQSESGWILRGVDMAEVHATYEAVKRLGVEGLSDPSKLIEAMRLNREYGMKHGFPTVYAMTNPSECFAEIAAHIILDPAAHQYLSSEVVDWFSNVMNQPL